MKGNVQSFSTEVDRPTVQDLTNNGNWTNIYRREIVRKKWKCGICNCASAKDSVLFEVRSASVNLVNVVLCNIEEPGASCHTEYFSEQVHFCIDITWSYTYITKTKKQVLNSWINAPVYITVLSQWNIPFNLVF